MFDAPPILNIAPCSLGRWMNQLDPIDRSNVQVWLDSAISSTQMRREIIDQTSPESEMFSIETISDHRNGRCRCSALRP